VFVLPRLLKLGLLVVLVGSAAGCCIVPPRGWGHGQRDYGGHAQAEPMPGQGRSRGGDNQRMSPDGQRH
jgi:hypothetical protein